MTICWSVLRWLENPKLFLQFPMKGFCVCVAQIHYNTLLMKPTQSV